jgi:DNA-binding MarR family transcriptional regulator
MVHIMNNNKTQATPNISERQVEKFHETITKLFQCCQQRTQFQSEKFDLPDAELRCLMLFSNERYLTAKSIAYKMNVVKSRITKIIDGLEEKQLVKRMKDPADSRVTLISLTQAGHNKLIQIKAFQDFVYREVLGSMAPEQRKAMITNLELLKVSMEALKEMMA